MSQLLLPDAPNFLGSSQRAGATLKLQRCCLLGFGGRFFFPKEEEEEVRPVKLQQFVNRKNAAEGDA